MIQGRVTSQRQALITVEVYGPRGPSEPADMIVDTGFTGFLALPSDLIARLGLPCLGLRTAFLADGREAVLNLFEAVMEWHGQLRRVLALEVRRGALLGMALLHGSRLTMDAVENGPVRIEPIHPP
jgi:clan AA aspartic protease